MLLRQLSNHPKIILPDSDIASGKFTDVTNYLETLVKSNQKVIVFSSFVSHLELYKKWCEQSGFNYCYLTGSTATNERETEINRFKNNENISLFFLSIGAANVGLNLQEASYVVFLDPWWNPFKELQAISRAHRMGQKYKVEVVKFIAKNTIEEKIIQLQNSKKILAEHIIEDDFLPDAAIQNLDYLLQ
jgi:non-specific serine/threonine protein kinase